jgi:SAM-dependent methyltransferase
MTRKLYAERPGWGKDFDYDEARHLVAYRYAAALVAGKRVLDAGCGEGFATQTLADAATSVVGADYHAEAIGTACSRWQRSNLAFRVLDLAAAEPDDAFDVVLNFQVIEHIPDDRGFVSKLARWLKPGGTLMLTTPNKLQSFSENPCHLREYTADELRALLAAAFSKVELLGVFGNERVVEFDRNRRRAVERILRLDPLGFRHLLPERLLHLAFARLGQVVRRAAHRSVGTATIEIDDFSIRGGEGRGENLARATDLVALCKP